MKKILVSILLISTVIPALAHGPHHGGHYHGSGWGWVAPALIGGAVVYAATRPVYTPPPQVVVVQPTLPPPPFGFHYETILDANCSCYRQVLVQN